MSGQTPDPDDWPDAEWYECVNSTSELRLRQTGQIEFKELIGYGRMVIDQVSKHTVWLALSASMSYEITSG